jgi:ATP-dependent RNA helicase DeaD
MEKFKELGLTEKTLSALKIRGFEEPTEIQSITIPLILKNERDMVAQAQTGTGKTAAFALPLLEILKTSVRHTQAIILAPTRELVIQIAEEINSLKGITDVVCAPIYGGQSMELQLAKLKRGVSIVVGTPGRIIDHLHRKTLHLEKVDFVVLDEGDEMLNMGFIEDIEEILEHTPETKRVYLFSATMPQRIKDLASTYMKDYVHVKAQNTLTTNLTDQIYFEVDRYDKLEALCRIIDLEKSFYGIIFCRTKIEVDELASKLIDRGYPAEALHGDISQSQRETILRKFKKQQISMLVATDVAARGIDVNNLTHVINFSLPQDPESYVHRIGRTGRAGNQGTAVTFITPDEFSKLGFIKRVTKATIQRKEIPGVDQIVNARVERITTEIQGNITSAKESQYHLWADILLQQGNTKDILAAVLQTAYNKVLDKSSYRKITPIKQRSERRDDRRDDRSDRGFPRERYLTEEEGQTRLYITKGKVDSFTKRSLVDFIVKFAGTPRSIIDNVEVFDNFSFITVPFEEAEKILAKLKKSKGEDRRLLIEKAKPASKERRRR